LPAPDPTQRQDRRRVLTGLSRWDDETPDELVIELVPDGSGHGGRGAAALRPGVRN
jgi:hypothetical protein